jgi:hypothetical protein
MTAAIATAVSNGIAVFDMERANTIIVFPPFGDLEFQYFDLPQLSIGAPSCDWNRTRSGAANDATQAQRVRSR